MKLLVDSCVAEAVTRALRDAGHDVVWTVDHPPDPGDEAILAWAERDGRAIVTIDSDFGALVHGRPDCKVGVLRLPERSPAALAGRAVELVEQYATAMAAGALVIEGLRNVRVRDR